MPSRNYIASMLCFSLVMAVYALEAQARDQAPTTNSIQTIPPVSIAGIGILFAENKGQISITMIVQDSPAKKAGLRVGDIITQIDHLNIAGKSKSEVANLLKGNPDTVVNLTYIRDAEPPRYAALIRNASRIS